MRRWARNVEILMIALISAPIAPTYAQCAQFEATYIFSGGFHIYGHIPVPQVDGFDYYFTPVAVDSSLLGKGMTISSISVSTPGTSTGEVVNWDWEVFIGNSSFGLPEGQFTATTDDPVDDYVRTAQTQLQFVIGSFFGSGEYTFSGEYDFLTGTMTAYPQLGTLKNASTSEMELTEGLYAQLFFWTGDNRNCYIVFDDITLTVRGEIREPSPEPVPVDIKPGSCPNPLNTKSQGVLLVAILGTEDFDVNEVDSATLQLEDISPLRWGVEDVATPFDGEPYDCNELGPDGFEDLALKFDTQELVSALGPVNDGEEIALTLRGNLLDVKTYRGAGLGGHNL
jgi:hypothetical protein